MQPRRRVPGQAVGEQGSTVLIVLLLMACVAAASGGVLVLTTSDRAMAFNFAAQVRTSCAADAMAAYAMASLADGGAWARALQAGGHAPFADESWLVLTSWGRTLAVGEETTALQGRSNRRWPAGSDRPVWHLFAWGSLDRLIAEEPVASAPYVMAWVADNPADGDGDPERDTDGVLMLRAEARLGTFSQAVEVFLRWEPANNSESAAPMNEEAGSDSRASPGMARILPTGGMTVTGGGARVRVLTWRTAS